MQEEEPALAALCATALELHEELRAPFADVARDGTVAANILENLIDAVDYLTYFEDQSTTSDWEVVLCRENIVRMTALAARTDETGLDRGIDCVTRFLGVRQSLV